MFVPDLVVRSRRVVTPRGTQPAAIHIRSGKIIGVVGYDDVPAGCPVDEAGDAAVLPGLVDTFAHLSGGVSRATQAAAAGGITTVLAVPVDGIVAPESSSVDIGYWGLASADRVSELRATAETGVFGFICGHARETDLRLVMSAVRRLESTLVVASEIGAGLASEDASELAIRICGELRTRTHLHELSSTNALASLYRARTAGFPITAGTSPRRLTLASDMHEREERELLWAALAGGVLQAIASDRSPPQLSMSAIWTEAHARGYTLDQLAQWMCQMPARLARLDRKAAIEVGYDADLVVFDPDAKVKPAVTLYLGHTLRGRIERTYLRGARIYDGAKFLSPCGKLLLRRL